MRDKAKLNKPLFRSPMVGLISRFSYMWQYFCFPQYFSRWSCPTSLPLPTTSLSLPMEVHHGLPFLVQAVVKESKLELRKSSQYQKLGCLSLKSLCVRLTISTGKLLSPLTLLVAHIWRWTMQAFSQWFQHAPGLQSDSSLLLLQ